MSVWGLPVAFVMQMHREVIFVVHASLSLSLNIYTVPCSNFLANLISKNHVIHLPFFGVWVVIIFILTSYWYSCLWYKRISTLGQPYLNLSFPTLNIFWKCHYLSHSYRRLGSQKENEIVSLFFYNQTHMAAFANIFFWVFLFRLHFR